MRDIHLWGRRGRIIGAIGLLLALAGCSEKEAAFFEAVTGSAPEQGAIDVTVTGAPDGALVTVVGAGINRTEEVGSAGHSFESLPAGSYTVSVASPAGFACTPPTSEIVVASGTSAVSIDCQPQPGTIEVTVTGAPDGALVTVTGPSTNRSTTVSGAGSAFEDLPPGTYTVTVLAPAGYNCAPLTSEVEVDAGTVRALVVECQQLTGSITATVNGTTATVNYSGPATGGGAVGSTPTTFGSLPAGDYDVVIASPAGWLCVPAAVLVALLPGGNEAVEFTCEAEPDQPTVLDLNISGIPHSGGVVAPGTYAIPLLDESSVVQGNLNLETIGTSLFFGSGPTRLGAGFLSGFGLVYVGITAGGQPFIVTMMQVCVLNAALDAGHPMLVRHLGAGGAFLGGESVISSPQCVTSPVPAGTQRTEVTAPSNGFIDINMLRLWR